ncbi:hypothetical protein HYP85_gp051 [Pseudomonas phage Zuri]|uniref:Uncharacterized protein n=1 Tax=Pseudomonas phage Zuri TaxID=2604899 RepID=A0A5C1K5P6_9CAUD|nr:hypothetical protein HYP85_gp051 [Pseudomonas phage Zuri]QEM41148.1 hypothetical protein Zuri_51 [Pseudomonas phage Zuri]
MCERCVADSLVNLNNSQAILNLANAAHTLDSINAASEKNTVLRRLDAMAELPRNSGEAEAATAPAQSEDTGRTGEAPSANADVTLSQHVRRLVELGQALGFEVEVHSIKL